MSTLTYDFHSICINCRVLIAILFNRCNECAVISDDVMTNYVKHRKQLKAKYRCKSKSKDPLLSASAIDDSAIVSDDPSSVDVPPALVDVPLVDDVDGKVDAELSVIKNE